MAGLGRFAAYGLLVSLAACGSSGVVPKAFDAKSPPLGAAAIDGADNDPAEPVIIAPEVIDGWKFLYRFITETEFVLCLEGTHKDGRVTIDGFRLARMEASNVNSVRYQPCTSSRYVGTAHNHPPVGDRVSSLCYQSEPDRRSFRLDQRAIVDIVLCGADQFYWVMKDGRSAARYTELVRGP